MSNTRRRAKRYDRINVMGYDCLLGSKPSRSEQICHLYEPVYDPSDDRWVIGIQDGGSTGWDRCELRIPAKTQAEAQQVARRASEVLRKIEAA